MTENSTFQRILDLIEREEVKISAHGYDELAADDMLVKDVMANVSEAEVLEDYPDFPKDRVYWYCKKILLVSQSTPYGEFRKMLHRQRFWSRHIGQTHRAGQMTSEGESHDPKAHHKTRS